MSKSGYAQLLDNDDDENSLLSPFNDNSAASTGSPNFKIITSQPLSSSAPVGSFLNQFRNKPNDLESQPLLSNNNNDDPDDDSNVELFNNRITRTTSIPRSIISLDLKVINDKVSKWTSSLWTSSPKINGVTTEIQYSVFKPLDRLRPLQRLPAQGFISFGPVSQIEFNQIVEDSIRAINELDIKPKRITSGSSGSYFIYDTNNEIVGVFKPKDEEPYGPLSPKWTKWFHRNLFPCFFGRSCLIPNLGYICESAASLLDCQLNTFIVPFTGIVSISSDSFYYSYWDRKSKKKLPSKVGSFQLFLNGYIEADKFFEKYPLPGSRWSLPGLYYTYNGTQMLSPVEPTINSVTYCDDDDINSVDNPEFKWTPDVIQQFREELEKLVILDYIMRNTDRGLDNWMIKIEWETQANGKKVPKIKIGAIDSGLSFPWKHPDEWRSYPFGWLFLPVSIIGQPFSEKTRNHFLPLLTSVKWWEECTVLFRSLFAKDSDFKERMWKKQWRVLKGQALNVVETLKNPSHGPLELVRRTRMLVHDQEMEVSVTIPISMMHSAMNTPMNSKSIPKRNNANANSLSIIDENTNLQSATLTKKSNRSINDDDNGDDTLQKNWNDLLNGEINEVEFQSPKSHIKTNNIANDSAKTNNSLDSNIFIDPTSTKTVIIERIQAVASKPPVFTCC